MFILATSESRAIEITVVDRGEVDDAWERWGIQDYAWSPDGRFIAYTKMERSLNDAIFVYSVERVEIHRITDHRYQDWSPAFSADGRYLTFLSNRSFSPVMGSVDQNHVFLDMALPYVALLRSGDASPFAPGADDDDDDNGDDGEDEDDEVVVEIDFDGIERRIVPADGVEPGNYFRLEATADGFLYLAKTELEFLKYQAVDDHTGGALELWSYDLGDGEAEKLMTEISNYHLSADAGTMVYRSGSDYGVVDAGSTADVGDGEVSLGDVRIKIDRQQEFQQIFAEAIKIKGLATLIGMRTWGGAVGIEPHQDLVDGGVTTPPQFGLFDFDGRWLIEGHGVDPDIEVQNSPADVLAGRDAQLEAALAYLADRMETDPMPVSDAPPKYPNKSKASADSL